MKLDALNIQNFLGLPAFRCTLGGRFLFVAAPNGYGKSSLLDALRFALLDQLARSVTKLGDRDKLITEGAKAGFVEVVVDGFAMRRNIGSGKLTGDTPEMPPMLDLCLDPGRFARMPEADRRHVLFTLSKVRPSRDNVIADLREHGIPDPLIEAVIPLLRDGFPACAAYASTKATEARGGWKALTGEAYGAVKAVTWKAKAPAEIPSDEALDKQRALVTTTEEKLQDAMAARGRVESAGDPAKVAALRAKAGQLVALHDAELKAGQAYTDAVEAMNAVTREIAQAEGDGLPSCACPSCGTLLAIDGEALHVAKAKPAGLAALRSKQQKAREAVQLADRDRQSTRQQVNEAQAAELALSELIIPTDADRTLAGTVDALRHDLGLFRAALSTLERDHADATSAEGITARALAEHERAVHWVTAAERLGPQGIPATLLAQALDPINDALAAQAELAGFRPARIERDLSLTYNGRDYGMCSKSEQWRADAMFAVVVATFTGIRLIALDEFDVLNPGDRGEVIDWLDGLTKETLDTVVVAGTLKAAPDLGDEIAVAWLGEPVQAAA